MKPDFATLGKWLEDPEVTVQEKINECEDMLFKHIRSDDAPEHVIGKLGCFLAYRSLDGRQPSEDIHVILEECENDIRSKDGEWLKPQTARWVGSIRMASIYLRIQSKFDPWGILGICQSMYRPGWMITNPSGMVNCCRSLALGMAVSTTMDDKGPCEYFHQACRHMFSLAVQHWKSTNATFCAGHELVQAARAVHTTVALLPLAGLPYSGHAYDVETIIRDTQDEEIMRSALRSILCP